MSPEELMRLAIDKCAEGIATGNSPFGCAIALGDRVLAVSHNCVLSTIDITAHAEIAALRAACQETGDILLAGATVASTCEPCPMCAAALLWARVDTVYFGTTIRDAMTAGFSQLTLPAGELAAKAGSSVKFVPGLMRDECLALFERWRAMPGGRGY